MNRNNFRDLLNAHLNVSWLRPESALWDAIASFYLSKCKITPPSLDLGCGNGIFSFITAGGRFSIDYDWYVNVDGSRMNGRMDIYDICLVSNLKKYITRNPGYKFTFGLDAKPNLLKQANLLGFYDNIIEHDANKRFPFRDGEFRTIFSNMLYWLKDLDRSLEEVHRILDTAGTALLCLPNAAFYDYCVSYQWKVRQSNLLKLLNGGRSESIHWTISYNEFIKKAGKAGFKITSHLYYLSPLTLKIWDIGLRPISSTLIKMANSLGNEKRAILKREWIDTVFDFLYPLYEFEKQGNAKMGFHLFVLKK
jgi:SAM-dependent methyltransferase